MFGKTMVSPWPENDGDFVVNETAIWNLSGEKVEQNDRNKFDEIAGTVSIMSALRAVTAIDRRC
jgi:hypothetical protein